MAGYVRQSSAEIADALTIEAVDLNNEFNDLVAAFSNTSGHKHDGTAAEGPVIAILGDEGVATPLNKILIDTTNKHLEFYTDVSSAAVQQLRIQDGAIVPILTNDIDVGTTALEFKDAFFDGTVNLDTLVIGSSTGVTSVDTDLTSASSSDDTLASAKAIKTYVDSVPVGDLTAIVAGTGLTGTSLSGPIPTLNVIGGNGITANADALVIDTTVTVDKTTAQILSSKTLTSPVLNGTLSGTAFLDDDTLADDSAIAVASQQSIKAYVDAQSHSTVTADSVTTFTNKTIDEDATGNSITNLANASIKAAAAIDATKIANGTVTNAEFQYINSLSSNAQSQIDLKAALASPALTGDPTAPTQSASDNSTKLATTAYVDGQVATENELSELNDVTIAGIADANYLIYDNAASVWKNKAISGAFTSDNLGVTTLSALIDAIKIADGTVTNTEFQYINTLSSNAQTQIDTKATAGFAVAMAIAL